MQFFEIIVIFPDHRISHLIDADAFHLLLIQENFSHTFLQSFPELPLFSEFLLYLMFKEEGWALGRMEAAARFGKLMSILLSKGLTEEAKLVSVDESMRNKLYKKYDID